MRRRLRAERGRDGEGQARIYKWRGPESPHHQRICSDVTWLGFWDGKYGIRDNYKLIISVFAAWRL